MVKNEIREKIEEKHKSNSVPYVSRDLHTVCPRSSDPFDIVTYYIILLGHTVVQ